MTQAKDHINLYGIFFGLLVHFDDLFLQEKKYLTEVLDKAGNGSELRFFYATAF